ncbi:hypothetical protein RQP46_011365 [Phenoliferia psychrophenolica]
MLQHSQRHRANQENPHASQAAQQHHPTKTPLRQQGQAHGHGGPMKGMLTGGKGLVGLDGTAKGGRVLGNKDGNQGKGSGSVQLTVTKPAHLSPPPAPSSVLPAHLRTPSPGVHRFAALSLASPEVEIEEAEPEPEEEEDLGDREVELAGESAADYDEPYEPSFPMPDFKKEGYGALLRALPMTGIEGHDAWTAQDELDRLATKIAPDVAAPEIARPDESSLPLFPLPKTQRSRILAPKSSNNALALGAGRLPPTPFARKALTAGPVPTPKPKPQWGAKSSAPTPTSRFATAPSRPTPASRPLAPFSRPPPSSSSSSSVSVSVSTTLRHPVPNTPRLVPTSSQRATSLSSKSMPSLRAVKKASSSSLATLPESQAAPAPSIRDAESDLGIWGLVDEDPSLFEDEELDEGFRFEL